MGHGYDVNLPGEEFRFSSPRDKWGTVLDSLDDLKKMFPETDELKELHKSSTEIDYIYPGFSRYAQKRKDLDSLFAIDVAYECYACKKFIVGPANTKSFDNIGALAGSKGYEYSCTNCNYILKHVDTEFS